MNIVHVVSTIDPGKGGPQAGVLRIAAAQATLGHKVHIVSYAESETEATACKAAASIPGIKEVRLHLLPNSSRFEAISCIEGARLLKVLLPAADFVHLHGVWEEILRKGAAIATRAGVPYCICPHGMLDSWSLSQKTWKKRLALRLGFRRMLDGAQFIHALNADEVRLMQPLLLRPPVIIIPNGVFLQEFQPLPDARLFNEQFGLPEERRFILFLSRLHFKKGLDILAVAFSKVIKECPDVDLVVAGPDHGAGKEFQRQVRKLGVENRVRMIGPIYGAEKLQALSAAACFCLPSRQEGFSLAIIEALACALPVVISDACHFPEVASTNAGIVAPLDAMEISSALKKVLKDEKLAKAMGANGRKLVMENFTWQVAAEKSIESYCLSAQEAAADGSRLPTCLAGLPA
jgi:glycosyltransferase involved in cell wall biosynthesis